jgi:hypothetical protein
MSPSFGLAPRQGGGNLKPQNGIYPQLEGVLFCGWVMGAR